MRQTLLNCGCVRGRVGWRRVEVFPDPDIARRSGETEHSLCAPISLVCEQSVTVGYVMAVSGVIQEATVLQQWDMIETEVEERRVHHAVSEKRKKCTNDGASDDVVSMVETIDCENTSLDRGTKEGSEDDNELPELRLVVRQEFEFSVEIERQEDSAGERGGGVAAGERF